MRRTHLLLLTLILLLAAGLRLYKINEYMAFLGDEGRDVLVVKRMIVDHKFTLLGPITSVGSIYMGPVYYYMMAPFLWIAQLNPVGPAIMVALLAVATVYLLYQLGTEFFSPLTGLVAALFYALSPLTILYGRSSWNPNVVPFFATLLIYALMKGVVQKKVWWLPTSAACLGILIQLHYVTFLFFLVIFLTLILIRFRLPIRIYAASLGAFLLTYSPFLAFEFRHGFVNMRGAMQFITQNDDGGGLTFQVVAHVMNDIFIRLFWRLLVIESAEITKLAMFGIGIGLVLYWLRIQKDKKRIRALSILLIWFVGGLIGYGLYHGVIYDYYMGSLFPLPFLFFGIVIDQLTTYQKKGKIAAFVLAVCLAIFSIRHSPLRIEPNNLLRNTSTISRFVHDHAEGKKYNFALIAGRNSDHAYRYFLDIWGNPPVVIENPVVDPDRKTVMEELWVVCEEKVCQPLGHPLWEIAGFGPAEIAGEWTVSTARIFRLVRYTAGAGL